MDLNTKQAYLGLRKEKKKARDDKQAADASVLAEIAKMQTAADLAITEDLKKGRMKYTITETEKQTLFTHDVEGGKKAYAPRGGFVVLTGGTNPIKKALEKTKLESTLQKKITRIPLATS